MDWNDKSPKPQRFAPGLTILGLALLSTLGIGNHALAAGRTREPHGQRGGNGLPASLAGVIRRATRRYLRADGARAAHRELV